MERKITLSQAAKQFNVGVNTIVEFLIKKGVKIDNNPKTHLTNELYELLDRSFNNSLFGSKADPTEITISKDKSLNILGHIELSELAENKKTTRKHDTISQPTVKLIGIVKFYDHHKDFGFIVTNGCDLSFIKETGNGLYDFYINSKSCVASAPNSNDWVIFDCTNQRATEVRKLDYNKETLSLAMKYRGIFAKIVGQDVFSTKSYDSSVLYEIINHYDKRRYSEIAQTFCNFVFNSPEQEVKSIIMEFMEDDKLLKSLIHIFFNPDIKVDGDVYPDILEKFKLGIIKTIISKYDLETIKMLILHLISINNVYSNEYLEKLFNVVANKTDFLSNLPLDFLQNKINETDFIEIIKYKINIRLSPDSEVLSEDNNEQIIQYFKQFVNLDINSQDKITNAVLSLYPEDTANKFRLLLYKNNCIRNIDECYFYDHQDWFDPDDIHKIILSHKTNDNQTFNISKSYMKYLYSLKDISSMCKIKNCVISNFSSDDYCKWESEWTANIPEEDVFKLWIDERNVIERDCSNYLFSNILDSDIKNYDILFNIKKITNQQIIDGLIDNLRNIIKIDTLPIFNKVFNHISISLRKEVAVVRRILEIGNPVFNVILWHLDKTDSFDFDTLRTMFIYFKPSDQVRIVKKLFMFADTQKMPLTIEMLDSLVRVDRNLFEIIAKEKPDIPIDISVDVVIKSLSKYAKEHKFFYNNEIFDIMLMNMKWSKKYDFRIDDFFDECTGRVDCRESISSIPYVTGKISTKNNNYEITIYSNREIGHQNGFFNRIKDEIKGKLHYSKWNAELKVWQAPIEDCNTTEIKRIAQTYNMQIEGDNEVKTQQTNAINSEYEYEYFPNPSNVTFCEGRLNETKWNNGKPFYWCRNLKCFKNAIVNHTSAEWEKYTMFDFLRILGINTDNVDKNQYLVLNGDYIVFVSIINRINELLEHLKCKTCGELLEPVEITDYASQLVTHFKCTNLNYNYDKCPEYGIVYYIHNCFNWKCRSIIDQRETTKCTNGWYICKECGSCCSTSNAEYMIKKQQERNRNTPSKTLLNFVKNNLGHVEKNEIYCFKCGNLTENYYCSKCKFKYDSRKLFNISHL